MSRFIEGHGLLDPAAGAFFPGPPRSSCWRIFPRASSIQLLAHFLPRASSIQLLTHFLLRASSIQLLAHFLLRASSIQLLAHSLPWGLDDPVAGAYSPGPSRSSCWCMLLRDRYKAPGRKCASSWIKETPGKNAPAAGSTRLRGTMRQQLNRRGPGGENVPTARSSRNQRAIECNQRNSHKQEDVITLHCSRQKDVLK